MVTKEPVEEVKPDLKPYPYHDGTPNENAPLRSIAVAKPECPMDSRPEIVDRNGVSRPNPNYTGEINCMEKYKLNGQGLWDIQKCMDAGHDPYYFTTRRNVLEEVTDDDGYVTETKVRVVKQKRLNVIRVTDNIRVSSRQEVPLALARGCKFLEEFGYASPCEFRNCSRPQKVETRFGNYCTERHARLVAADARRMMLFYGTGDPLAEDAGRQTKELDLDTININKAG